jgi:NRPS condensation-like uncharacterized protein
MGRAFESLLRRRPILRTTIVREGEHSWLEWSDQPAEFEVLPRDHDEAWRDEFQRQMRATVVTEGGPPIRLRVLTSGGRGGELVLSCHHTVCDGRSITQFCGDLVYEYDALLGRRAPTHVARVGQIPPTMEEVLPERLRGDDYQELARQFITDRMKGMQELHPWLMTPYKGEPTSPALLRYRLPPEDIARLRARGHDEKATIQGAVTAALLHSAVDLAGDPDAEIAFLSSLDLRPYMHRDVPLADMGLFAGSIIDVRGGIGGTPFWALAPYSALSGGQAPPGGQD